MENHFFTGLIVQELVNYLGGQFHVVDGGQVHVVAGGQVHVVAGGQVHVAVTCVSKHKMVVFMLFEYKKHAIFEQYSSINAR